VSAHSTSLETEHHGTERYRARWTCSCGAVGPWAQSTRNANVGASKHVAMLGRWRLMGRRIEEHW
jgi:hypothetical protein